MKLKRIDLVLEEQLEDLLGENKDFWERKGHREYSRFYLRKFLNRGHNVEVGKDEFFVFIEDDKIVGFGSIIIHLSDCAFILDLYIFPSFDKKYFSLMLE